MNRQDSFKRVKSPAFMRLGGRRSHEQCAQECCSRWEDNHLDQPSAGAFVRYIGLRKGA